MCCASACAVVVRTEWVNVQPWSHEDRGGRDRTATSREPAGGAVGAHGTAPDTMLGPQPTLWQSKFSEVKPPVPL